jgi:hypothetical protein
MIHNPAKFGLRMALLVAMLVLGLSAPCSAFFPPDVVPGPPQPKVIPPPPCDQFKHHTPPPPPQCCNCCVPPHVHTTPEPFTLVSSLVGLTILGGYGLHRRLRKK